MATRVTPEVATLRREVQDKYTEVATYPERTFHFHHGRPLAELLGMLATSTNGTVWDPRDQRCGRAWVNSLRVRL